MALDEDTKIAIRRHLGYGPYGDTASGGSMMAYRFFTHHGLLEYRMDHLRSKEEDVLTGTNNSSPSFTDPESETTIYGYIPILNFLEGKILTSTDNMDILKAGEYSARQDELAERNKLYTLWVLNMARYLYLPVAPYAFKQHRGQLVN